VFLEKKISINYTSSLFLTINFYIPWFTSDKGKAKGDEQVIFTHSFESLNDRFTQLIWLVDEWLFGVAIKNCSNRFIKIYELIVILIIAAY